ncbi:MAG: mechanosensitive ion channel, partial [Clostridiales bacterium]
MKVYNEFWEWIQGVEWLNIIITGAKMIIILLLAFIILTVLKKILRKTLEKNSALQENRRAVTMTSILYSISKYIIYFIAVMVVFSMMGIDIAPVLASAGVLGLAVGFGAQNLVKDTISGFFIIFDNYFSVGDYIKTCGV